MRDVGPTTKDNHTCSSNSPSLRILAENEANFALRISNIREDTATLTTYLTAQPAPWSDVAGTYDMDFGKAIPFTRPNHLQSRGLWGDITGAVKGAVNDVKNGVKDVTNGVKQVASDVGNVLTGNLDLSKSVSFGMNAGTPNQKKQLFTDK